ncbi:MAG TPA: MqnA/MqnD/SBP family protein [Thermomicrobiales bacterium]|nr:MqnA/MqnD/SBP family protein [Thermomicrobiales bacterium]
MLDDRLETVMFGYPLSAGWIEADGVSRVPYLPPSMIGDATLALVDSIAALTMLGSHVIVRDIAVVCRHSSMLTLLTHTRPDEVEEVAVSIPGVSPAGRAVATAVLQPFYGIRVLAWSEDDHAVDSAHATLTEGTLALIPVHDEQQYQEDLGRAWFLMTDRPFVSHVAVAPRATLASSPAGVLAAVERLLESRRVASERGRELRRDLSRGLAIDRDTLTDTLADQTHELDDDALDGLAVLAARGGLRMSRRELMDALISVSPGR